MHAQDFNLVLQCTRQHTVLLDCVHTRKILEEAERHRYKSGYGTKYPTDIRMCYGQPCKHAERLGTV
jgi:hypothetical protein